MSQDKLIDGKYEYFAFISYKEEDAEWAKWLQRKLEHYKLPIAIRKEKPELPERISPIYEYKSEAGGGRLKEVIWKGLTNSKYLIVICSPRSGGNKSEWINNGIRHLIESELEENIIPFIIEGKPKAENSNEECFPAALLELKNDRELRGININEMGRDAAVVKVVSRMFDVKFDKLWQRYEKEQRKKRIWMIAGAIAILLFVSGIALWMYFQYQRTQWANWKMMENQTRFVTEEVSDLLGNGDALLSQLLLLEVLPKDVEKPNRPYVSEAEVSLRKAHNMNCYVLAHSNVMLPKMSTDGKFVLVGNENGTVTAIDVNTGNSKKIIHKQDIYSASFSPNQKLLSTIVGRGGSWSSDNPKEYSDILLWNADNGNLKMVLKGHTEQVIKTVFSNDGKYIVSSSWDGSVRLWDTSTGKCIKKIEKGKSIHESIMGESIEEKSISLSIALSPDGNRLLTSFTPSNIEIWDVQQGICIDSLIGHSDAIRSFQFSPDGKEIVSSESDYTIRFWDVSTGNCKRTLKGHNGNIWDVSYNYDGSKVVTTSSDSTVRIWNLHNDTCENAIKINADAMKASFTPNGQKIIIYTNDKNVRVWEPYKNPTKALANSIVISTAISPNGEYIALKSVADNVKIWNVKNQRELCLNNDTYVESLFFDNKGTKLVTTSYNSLGHTVNVWNTKTLELLSTFKPENGWSRFKAVNISDDNTTIITVSDSTIGLWDANTGNSIKRIPNSIVRNMSNRISISPNGKMCAIATNNDSIYLMNILTMKPVISLGRQRGVTCLSFSEENRVLASGSSDGIIKLFHILNDNNPMLLDGGTEVVGLYFSRDMKYLASTHNDYISHDGKVIVWNIETGNKVSTFNEKGEKILSVHFDIEQGTIEGVSEKGIWYIWPFPSLQQLINETRERFKNRQLTHEEKRKYYIE